MKLNEIPDTWPVVMAEVAVELLRRGILHPTATAQQVVAAAENVTGIIPSATDSLQDVAARWQDWLKQHPAPGQAGAIAPAPLPKPPTA